LLPEDLGEPAEAAEALEDPRYKPLSPGDPLRAYLPHGLAVEQDHENDGIRVHEPGRVADTFYHRCPAPEQITAEYAKRIREILIKGQVSVYQTTITPPFPFFWVFLKRRSFFLFLFHFISPRSAQGHSSWGEFELIGRVRAGDGFVTLSKEYVSAPPFFFF
jgi:hypothetical protein